MSGGSYSYLFQTEPDDLLTRGDDLAAMRDRLVELGYADVAVRVTAIISTAERYRETVERLMDPIAEVMRGVEWLDSNDWGADQLADEIAKYRAAFPEPSAEELHRRFAHPDYEYETTEGQRKCWDEVNEPPEGDGWERNVDAGRDGWERFDYTEESYWRRSRHRPDPTEES